MSSETDSQNPITQGSETDRSAANQPVLDNAQVVQALASIAGADAVLSAQEDLRPYECDGLSAYRHVPMVVVLPGTVAQVQAIVPVKHWMELLDEAMEAANG